MRLLCLATEDVLVNRTYEWKVEEEEVGRIKQQLSLNRQV
jgi:hypothetical protein